MSYCPNCGAQVAENSTQCNVCGTPIVTAQATESIPTKPDGKPLGKQNYLLLAAPKQTRIMTYILLGVALACVLFIMITSFSIQNRDFTEIGIIDMMVGDDDMEAFNEDREELLDEIDDLIDEDDDDLIDEFEDEYNMDIEEVRDIVEKFSLQSMIVILEAEDEDEEIISAFKFVLSFMTICAIGSAALVILATLFGQTWLVIVNYIFSILYYILLAGFGSFIFASVLFIALAVLMKKQNKAYKSYKQTVLNQF